MATHRGHRPKQIQQSAVSSQPVVLPYSTLVCGHPFWRLIIEYDCIQVMHTCLLCLLCLLCPFRNATQPCQHISCVCEWCGHRAVAARRARLAAGSWKRISQPLISESHPCANQGAWSSNIPSGKIPISIT